MLSYLHLKPFYIYNIILIIVFSIIVNPIKEFSFLFSSLYFAFHFLIIYLGVYHYRKSLYILYFLYGLGLDILWFNEIGPHLLVFMIILVFFKFSQKYLYFLSSYKIYILLIFVQLLMIFLEMFFLYLLFDVKPYSLFFFKAAIFSLIMSYPIFIFFSKIDEIK